MNKVCIVITTINAPTKAIIEYSQIQNTNLVIVCDIKTPIEVY